MKILIAGDFCPRGEVAELFEHENYAEVLGHIAHIIKSVDYSIVNFECPIVNGTGTPILKNGGNLKSSDKAISALKYAGFNCATLANNHFRDFGDDGCLNTIAELDRAGVDHIGGGVNLEESQKVLYKEIGGTILAFVNFCEHEFSIAEDIKSGSAPLDMIDNFWQIKEAKENADIVIVIVHGGHEYYQLPSPRMKKTYRWFTEIGTDVVINHHQHCYTGYEIYNGKPIFYGLGNFCFDWNRRNIAMWEEGYMVELEINNHNINSPLLSFMLIPYTQCRNGASVIPMQDGEKEQFFNSIERFNAIISDDNQLTAHFNDWCKSKNDTNESLLVPYTRRLTRSLYAKGLLPSVITKRKLIALLNHIDCETHRDVFIKYLKDHI